MERRLKPTAVTTTSLSLSPKPPATTIQRPDHHEAAAPPPTMAFSPVKKSSKT
ncbi:hypothetical protein FH972_015439 [Carpinus fangiana]|uniref:Uncharacterized protein n=1 Tax=Carpinus fangiana TaxID=176857 RepID=A0A5N6RDX2_9ROSI|nr:hypothetical protein FH972_015439 [Carpinus fangiana]